MINTLAVITWMLFTAWTIRIGVRKHRIWLGVILGVAFSWIGCIILAIIPARKEING